MKTLLTLIVSIEAGVYLRKPLSYHRKWFNLLMILLIKPIVNSLNIYLVNYRLYSLVNLGRLSIIIRQTNHSQHLCLQCLCIELPFQLPTLDTLGHVAKWLWDEDFALPGSAVSSLIM